MEDISRCWGVAHDGTRVEIMLRRGSITFLAQRWPPIGLRRSEKPAGSGVRLLDLTVTDPDGEPAVQVDGVPSPGGWDRVESELALFAAERLTDLVAVHAAVVKWADAALLVPGPSHSGKSTLCVAASALGAAVLSDEYALVDPVNGRVSGWPRPVRMRRPDGEVDRLDLVVASEPLRVGMVALLHYEAGSEGAGRPVPEADVVLGLLANTVCARSRPDEALDAACAVARSSLAVAGARGEAAPAAEQLLAMLEAPAA